MSGIASIKKDYEELVENINREGGVVDHLLEELKKDFGCKNIKEAKKALDQMEKELAKLDNTIQESIEVYHDKWGERAEKQS